MTLCADCQPLFLFLLHIQRCAFLCVVECCQVRLHRPFPKRLCTLVSCLSVHRVALWWGGEMCHVSKAHTLATHGRQHISSVCSTFPYICKITRANESMLFQSDYCPFASQGLSHLWLAPHGFVVLWLPARKARPRLMPITMHLQRIIFSNALMRVTNYTHGGATGENIL